MEKEKFDLSKWKSGEYDVVTRDGKSVRILCTDAKCLHPIHALLNNYGVDYCCTFTIDGYFYHKDEESPNDIFLVQKKWMSRKDEIFYYIDELFEIRQQYYENSGYFNMFVEINNYFKTTEEAEVMAEKIKELFRKEK